MIATTGLTKTQWAEVTNTQVRRAYESLFNQSIPREMCYGEVCKRIVARIGRDAAFQMIKSFSAL